MNTKKMAKRLKDSGVSPVIATILMVAITVVLAAVLYVMVSGFTHSPGTANSAGLTESSNTTASGNYVITISSISASNIPISNLKVVISGATTGLDGTFSISAAGTAVYVPSTATSSTTATAYVVLWTISGNSATYLSVGDFINVNLGGAAASGSSFSGATVTVYNGNAQLGTTTL
jgi:flagellin-like protein